MKAKAGPTIEWPDLSFRQVIGSPALGLLQQARQSEPGKCPVFGLAVEEKLPSGGPFLPAARRREVLPVPPLRGVFPSGVPLPQTLNGLIGVAPRRLYENLFAAVSATLTEFAGGPRHLPFNLVRVGG